MALFQPLQSKLVEYGAKKIGQWAGLKPKATAPTSSWNQQLQGIHKAATDKSLTLNTPGVMEGLGSNVMNIKSNPRKTNPAAADVTKPLAPKPTPVPSGFQSTLSKDDPAAIGGAMMNKAPTPPPSSSAGETTPPSPTSSPDYSAQLKAARDRYLKTFDVPGEVTTTQEGLSAIGSETAAATAKANQEYADRMRAVQEQATLQPFLTGRQLQAGEQLTNQLAALKSSSEARTLPLSERLAIFQQQQQAARDRAEAELSFIPGAKEVSPVSVASGSSLVDPSTGKVIYHSPEKADSKDQTATIEEYEYAKNAGYAGSFLEYLRAKSEAGRAGEVSNKPLSSDAAKVYSIATTIRPEVDALKAMLTKLNGDRTGLTGIFTGWNTEGSRLVDQIADKVGRLRSGGAINKDEAERFKAQIIRKMDLVSGDTSSAISALEALMAEADSVASSMKFQGVSSDSSSGVDNSSEGGFNW